MEVTITTRHCTVPPATRYHAVERVRRLERYEPRPATAVVNFDSDHGEKHVETRVNVHGGRSVVARATGATFRAALARSVERIARQLRRSRDRQRSRRALPRPDRVALPVE